MENKSEYYNDTHLPMDEVFNGANGMSDVGDNESNKPSKLQSQITSSKALDRKLTFTMPPAADGKIFQASTKHSDSCLNSKDDTVTDNNISKTDSEVVARDESKLSSITSSICSLHCLTLVCIFLFGMSATTVLEYVLSPITNKDGTGKICFSLSNCSIKDTTTNKYNILFFTFRHQTKSQLHRNQILNTVINQRQ